MFAGTSAIVSKVAIGAYSNAHLGVTIGPGELRSLENTRIQAELCVIVAICAIGAALHAGVGLVMPVVFLWSGRADSHAGESGIILEVHDYCTVDGMIGA